MHWKAWIVTAAMADGESQNEYPGDDGGEVRGHNSRDVLCCCVLDERWSSSDLVGGDTEFVQVISRKMYSAKCQA